MNVAKVGKRLRDFYILTLHKNCLNGRIQDVTKRLDLGRYPRNSLSKRLCFLGERIECLDENFDCLREYNGVIRKVKISDRNCSERQSAARIFRHPSQYMVHVSLEDFCGENTSMAHLSIN